MKARLACSAAVALCAFAASARADVVISTDTTQNMTCSGGVCSPTQTAAVLNIDDLTSLLATSDVTIVTQIDSNHDALNIDLVAPLSWSNSSVLTLTERYQLMIGAPVTVAGAGAITITSGCLTCILLMNNATVTFQNLSSSFVVAGLRYTLVGDLPTLVSDITGKKVGYYALANDFDAHDDQFSSAPIPKFNGEIIGLGHAIANLTIKHGSKKCAGLISLNLGYVSDLHLASATVSSRQSNVGGLAGCNHGVLVHVAVDGTISGSGNVGGVAGNNAGGIQLSRAAVQVSGGQSGGIAGENDGNISLSFATGMVTGNNNTGGLAGSSTGSVTDSYAMVEVSGNGGAAGGLLGFNNGNLKRAYSTGPATGASGFTGGFVGYDPNEKISTSYWDVDTSQLGNGAGFPVSDPGIAGCTSSDQFGQLSIVAKRGSGSSLVGFQASAF